MLVTVKKQRGNKRDNMLCILFSSHYKKEWN